MRRRAAIRRGSAAPQDGRLLPACLAALVLLLLAAIGVGASAPAARAVFHYRDDWRHVDAVVAALNKRPPSDPVVLWLGGSAAREAITTEPAWRAQIRAYGGGRVRAYDLGASSQTFNKNIEIVNALPAVPAIVLIGLNVGRYTATAPKARAAASSARGGSVYDSHRFHNGQQLSDGVKLALARQWMRVKYPRFKARYVTHTAKLRELIAVCQEKGFYPVLVELPVDLRIVKRVWRAPRSRYRSGCRAVARAYGIPYADFVGSSGLVGRDFADLAHLVESGRAKYQRRLSRLVVAKLRHYGMNIKDPT